MYAFARNLPWGCGQQYTSVLRRMDSVMGAVLQVTRLPSVLRTPSH